MLTQKALLARVIFRWTTLYKGRPPPPFLFPHIFFVCANTGVSTTIWRNAVWNGVYFFSLHEIRNRLPPQTPSSSFTTHLLQTLGAGFAAGDGGLVSAASV
jgi:hypothetical protein